MAYIWLVLSDIDPCFPALHAIESRYNRLYGIGSFPTCWLVLRANEDQQSAAYR